MPAQGVQIGAPLSISMEVLFVSEARAAMRALVVAEGDVPRREALDAAWPGWDAGVSLIVAADGGWDKAASLGLRPDLLVGDADSLPEARFVALAAEGVPIERSPTDKDESDTELALLAAIRRGATHVTVLGALGGKRFDHALANVGLLSLPDPEIVEVELLDGATRVRLLRAPSAGGACGAAGATVSCALTGQTGDLVSLLPLGVPALGVTTHGLLYPLHDGTLPLGPARGLSNVRIAAGASVTLREGRLLVVETRTAKSA
jgi:thiamine pyrophosphokinase